MQLDTYRLPLATDTYFVVVLIIAFKLLYNIIILKTYHWLCCPSHLENQRQVSVIIAIVPTTHKIIPK